MSGGEVHHSTKSETSIVNMVFWLFLGLLVLCGLDFANNAGKNELLPASHKAH